MADDLGDRIRANPKYQELVSKRNSYSWMMTILMLVVYYGYILLVAFNKPFLAQRLGDSRSDEKIRRRRAGARCRQTQGDVRRVAG